jgi:hypothetical protein
MAQWSANDAANDSPMWAPAMYGKAPTRANANTLYGNTTSDAYVSGQTIGVYGVDSTEIAVDGGKVAHTGWVVRTVGSGGRAGRVQTEVLVAGGIVTSNADDDAIYPDS